MVRLCHMLLGGGVRWCIRCLRGSVPWRPQVLRRMFLGADRGGSPGPRGPTQVEEADTVCVDGFRENLGLVGLRHGISSSRALQTAAPGWGVAGRQ